MTENVIKTNAAECATFGRIISLKVDDIDVNYSLDKLSGAIEKAFETNASLSDRDFGHILFEEESNEANTTNIKTTIIEMKEDNKKHIAFTQIPTYIEHFPQVETMVDELGASGLGTWLHLVQKIYRNPSMSITKTQAEGEKLKGVTKNTIKKVIYNYGLFDIDDYGHVRSTIPLVNVDSAKSQSKRKKKSNESKSDCQPSPARVYNIREKEDDRKRLTSSIKKEQGLALIGLLDKDSDWGHSITCDPELGELLYRHWDEALELFKQHVMRQNTIENLTDIDKTQKYFANYCSNDYTRPKLKQHLDKLEENTKHDNPYKYEDATSCIGNRSYMGIPIPDCAPPRPSDTARWDQTKWLDF